METENPDDGGKQVGTHVNIELGFDAAAVFQIHVRDRYGESTAAWDLEDWAAKAEADLLGSRREGAGCLRRRTARGETQEKAMDSRH